MADETKLTEAEIAQAVKAAGDGFWNDCKDCRTRIALLALAAELDAAKAGRVQAEYERDEWKRVATEQAKLHDEDTPPQAGPMPWQLHIAAILMNYCGDDAEAALAKAAQLNDAYAAHAAGGAE